MNLLLLKADDFIGDNLAEISGRRFLHLKKILKVTPGQTLVAGLLNGHSGWASVREITNRSIIVSLQLTQTSPPSFNCILVLALPRPLMLKRILQAVSSLGLKEIHLIQTSAVEKSYWNSTDLDAHILEEQLLLGLEQAMDTRLPTLVLHRQFNVFARETLPLLSSDRQCLVAHPGDHPPCPADVHGPLTLAIGPEGGFTTKEIDTFRQQGFSAVQIGQRILRVETAVNVLLGRLLPC